jgi:hypothetical protein
VDQMSTKQTHRVCLCTQLVAVKKPISHQQNTKETNKSVRVRVRVRVDPDAPSSLVGRAVISPLVYVMRSILRIRIRTAY